MDDRYVKLGDSDVAVTRMTFGAWAIGGWKWGPQDDRDAVAAIRRALDLGITSFDTAPVYGFGRSEELLAEALAGRRDEVQILTKYGLRWDRPEGPVRFDTRDQAGRRRRVRRNSRPDSIIEECERSLKRLGTDRIDLFQCHWPDPTTPMDQAMEAIDRLLQAGKIRAAGVSNFNCEQMAAVMDQVPLAASQPPFSMINRGAQTDVIPWCIEHNVAVLPYSPLQRGLLTGKFAEHSRLAPDDHRRENIFFRPANIRAVNEMLADIEPIAEAREATPAQLAIAWTLAQPGITSVLVGARNVEQVEQNVAALAVELSDDELSTIERRLSQLRLDLD